MTSSVTVQQRQKERPASPLPRIAPKGRLAALDGLRLLAALMVVLYHYIAFNSAAWSMPATERFPVAYVPASYGWLGVQLFFLISGFVICMSAWGRSIGDFATSRVTRLYPAYWFAVLAATVVVSIWPVNGVGPSLSDVAVNLTMFHEPMKVAPADGVYWTLWAEIRFYLLFALLIAWRGLTYRNVVGFCVVWAMAAAVAAGLDVDALDAVLMPNDCWFFIAGMAFYLMYRYGPNLLLWGIVAATFVAGQHFAFNTHHNVQKYVGHKLPLWPTVMLLALFYAAIAAVALGKTSKINWRWLPTAGALTYPLYLLHERIGWTVIKEFENDISRYVLVPALVALMLVASWLLHRYVERPLARALKRGMTKALADMRAPRERV
ncbi:acyltransferase family protein [Streptomyces sp. NPDC001678]|uniref:acyltransferase family protein n=1 Tax=Streptomyces sp. NPDC001678 TaxID=3364599 RepID=UPI0036A4948C